MEKNKRISPGTNPGEQKQETQKYYQKLLRELILQAEGSQGYLAIESVAWLHEEVKPFSKLARQKYADKDYQVASELTCTMLEEMTRAMEHTDDSKGDIARIIDQSLNLLMDIASEDLTRELRKYLFEYFISAFRKSTFYSWNWHFRMLDLALFLMKDDNEAQKILSLLDKDKYADNEEAMQIRLQVIRQTKGEKEADLYMQQNLAHPAFRTELIEKALRDEDFVKARKMAMEGIRQDEKEKPGLIFNWYELLLKIAHAEQNPKKIIEYARFLFIETPDESFPYYWFMKAQFEAVKWPDYLEGLISELKSRNRWSDFNLIAKIYIWEEWWDRLFEHVNQNLRLNYLEYYEKYLSDYDQPKLIGLYTKAILKLVEEKPDRKSYQEACYFIGRMILLGAVKEAEKLVKSLQNDYPARKALLDELKKIK